MLIVLMAGLFADYTPPVPIIVAKAQSAITVEAGDYELVGLAIIFAPGEGVGQHTHSGPDLVMVFEGEVTNQKLGSERTIKAGESWLDLPGEPHSVQNTGDSKARLWASLLLRKGDQSVLPAAQLPLDVQAGEYNLISFILDFAPGSGLPEQYHGGDAIFYVMDGEIMLMENGATKQVKAFKNWTEVSGAIYSVTNTSASSARVAVSMLLPKGAEETTVVSTPTPPATSSNVSTATLPATQNVSNSSFLPGLIVVGLLLIVLAAGFYYRRRVKR